MKNWKIVNFGCVCHYLHTWNLHNAFIWYKHKNINIGFFLVCATFSFIFMLCFFFLSSLFSCKCVIWRSINFWNKKFWHTFLNFRISRSFRFCAHGTKCDINILFEISVCAVKPYWYYLFWCCGNAYTYVHIYVCVYVHVIKFELKAT